MGVDHLLARFIVELMMLEGVGKVFSIMFYSVFSLPHLEVITNSFSFRRHVCLYLLKPTLSFVVGDYNFWGRRLLRDVYRE